MLRRAMMRYYAAAIYLLLPSTLSCRYHTTRPYYEVLLPKLRALVAAARYYTLYYCPAPVAGEYWSA